MRAAREFVTDTLLQHLPKTWRVVGGEQQLDVLDRLTVLVSVTAIRREPGAPMGAYDTTVTVTLASPKNDNLGAAETDLEDALQLLLLTIEDHFGTAWEPATKAMFAGRYLCWDVPLHVTTSRKD